MIPLPQNGVVQTHVHAPAAWSDARGELGAPFYTAAFDFGIDALKDLIGIDEAYRHAARRSTVALEAHVAFLARVPIAAALRIDSRIVDHDAKRLHTAQRLYHGSVLAATREGITLSFDLEARRSCPFEAAILARIEALYEAQRALPAHVGTAHLLGVDRILRADDGALT